MLEERNATVLMRHGAQLLEVVNRRFHGPSYDTYLPPCASLTRQHAAPVHISAFGPPVAASTLSLQLMAFLFYDYLALKPLFL